jgi:hypothetical protein
MRHLNNQEQTAIEAVARHFSATLGEGNDPSAAYISAAGKRIAVDNTTLKQLGIDQANAANPRLRFDKVATGLIERLQETLGQTVPDGMTVLLTITAPIRLPSKTAASLEDKIQMRLGLGSPSRDEKDTIHGNRIHIRFLTDQAEKAPKMIGFVHNPDTDPFLLFNMTRELLELINAEPSRPSPRPAGDRWLVITSTIKISSLTAYRYIYSQLRVASDYEKVLIVFADGHVVDL